MSDKATAGERVYGLEYRGHLHTAIPSRSLLIERYSLTHNTTCMEEEEDRDTGSRKRTERESESIGERKQDRETDTVPCESIWPP